MTLLIDAASWAVAGLVAVPCLDLGAELLTGLLPTREHGLPAALPAAVVIIPAHDEASVIGPTLRALQDAVPEGTRILVVADNCSDNTAEAARLCGADVIERQDPDLRGKGYALAYARDHLARRDDQPAVVVVIDADCQTDAASFRQLIGACSSTGRPAQAMYLLRAATVATPLVQISTFAFMLKNKVRARGLFRIAGAITLLGSGMAFPWQLFAGLPLASGHLTEDLELGVDLIRRGQGAILVSSAEVTSPPAAESDTREQRTRWEHGFLSVALRQALPLLAEGAKTARPALMAVGLDLLVPPLALMSAIVAGSIALLLAAWVSGGSPLPLLALTLLAVLAGGAVLLAWAVHGRALLRPAALVRVPLYIMWKLPLYLRFLTGRETRWVRTRRS